MRVLVTGGAGFIGSHVVDLLIRAGLEAHVADDLSSGCAANLPPNVPVHAVDIRDRQALGGVFDAVRPHLVSHQAAQISVSRSVEQPALDAAVNVMGWLHVLEHAVRTGVRRVVFASSGGALYGNVKAPASEDQVPQPVSPYGITKWMGEQYLRFYVRRTGITGAALRYANVYGPRQNPRGEAGVVAVFMRQLLSGSPPVIHGDGRSVRDYVFVQDVARANLLALTRRLPARFLTVNVGTGIGTSVRRLERLVRLHLAQALGLKELPAFEPPQHGPPRPGDLRSSILSPAGAKAALGWSPGVSLPDGLAATAAWYVQNR